MPASNVTVTATFVQTEFTLTLTTSTTPSGTGGTVTPSSATYYAVGSNVDIRAAVNDGYVFRGWTSSDVTVANANALETSFVIFFCS